MRYSSSEKYEIIQLVQQSNLSVTRTLARLDIHKSTFYNWLGRYHDGGLDALDDKNNNHRWRGIKCRLNIVKR